MTLFVPDIGNEIRAHSSSLITPFWIPNVAHADDLGDFFRVRFTYLYGKTPVKEGLYWSQMGVRIWTGPGRTSDLMEEVGRICKLEWERSTLYRSDPHQRVERALHLLSAEQKRGGPKEHVAAIMMGMPIIMNRIMKGS